MSEQDNSEISGSSSIPNGAYARGATANSSAATSTRGPLPSPATTATTPSADAHFVVEDRSNTSTYRPSGLGNTVLDSTAAVDESEMIGSNRSRSGSTRGSPTFHRNQQTANTASAIMPLDTPYLVYGASQQIASGSNNTVIPAESTIPNSAPAQSSASDTFSHAHVSEEFDEMGSPSPVSASLSAFASSRTHPPLTPLSIPSHSSHGGSTSTNAASWSRGYNMSAPRSANAGTGPTTHVGGIQPSAAFFHPSRPNQQPQPQHHGTSHAAYQSFQPYPTSLMSTPSRTTGMGIGRSDSPSNTLGVGAGTESIGARTSMSFTAEETMSLIGAGPGSVSGGAGANANSSTGGQRVPLSHFYSGSVASIGAKSKGGRAEPLLPVGGGSSARSPGRKSTSSARYPLSMNGSGIFSGPGATTTPVPAVPSLPALSFSQTNNNLLSLSAFNNAGNSPVSAAPSATSGNSRMRSSLERIFKRGPSLDSRAAPTTQSLVSVPASASVSVGGAGASHKGVQGAFSLSSVVSAVGASVRDVELKFTTKRDAHPGGGESTDGHASSSMMSGGEFGMRTEGSMDLDKTLTVPGTLLPTTFPIKTISEGTNRSTLREKGTMMSASTTIAPTNAIGPGSGGAGVGQGRRASRFPRFPLPATDDLRAVPIVKVVGGGKGNDGLPLTGMMTEKRRGHADAESTKDRTESSSNVLANLFRPPLHRSKDTSASTSSGNNNNNANANSNHAGAVSLKTRLVRKFELHESQNVFLFKGRLLSGGDSVIPFMVTLVLMLGIAGAWLGTTAVWWWRSEGNGGSKAVAIIGGYGILVALTSMFVTAFKDPGILPRNLDPEPPYSHVNQSEESVPMPLPRDLRVRQGIVRVKYCTTCRTYRPPRASHCRVCDNCVDGCDHHCQWVNNCVGRRNYTTFISFLIATFLCLCLFIVTSALHVYFEQRRGHVGTREALSRSVGSAVVFCLCAVTIFPVGGLLGYHLRLLALNMTTVEQIRMSAHKKVGEGPVPSNPFTRGNWRRNVLEMLCRPQGFSWLDPHGVAVADRREVNPGEEE